MVQLPEGSADLPVGASRKTAASFAFVREVNQGGDKREERDVMPASTSPRPEPDRSIRCPVADLRTANPHRRENGGDFHRATLGLFERTLHRQERSQSGRTRGCPRA